MTNSPEIINAREVLSQWYGPDSTVCDKVLIFSDQKAEAEFTVGKHLCGLDAYPPMFNRLQFVSDGILTVTTETSPDDARQHFIESVGISVVPGHNIIGLLAEAAKQIYHPETKAINLYMSGFDFVRFRNLILPGQGLCMTADIQKDKGVSYTFKMCGELRPFARNFRIEQGELINEAIKLALLAQHWITEFNAQGMGLLGLKNAGEGIVPVLMEVGKSTFAKFPVVAGDILRSELEITSAHETSLMGNARTFVGNTFIAEQQGILLGLAAIEEIREKIEQIKKKGASL